MALAIPAAARLVRDGRESDSMTAPPRGNDGRGSVSHLRDMTARVASRALAAGSGGLGGPGTRPAEGKAQLFNGGH